MENFHIISDNLGKRLSSVFHSNSHKKTAAHDKFGTFYFFIWSNLSNQAINLLVNQPINHVSQPINQSCFTATQDDLNLLPEQMFRQDVDRYQQQLEPTT